MLYAGCGLAGLGVVLMLQGLFLCFGAKRLANHPYSGMKSFWSGFYRQTETEIRRSGWNSMGAGAICLLSWAALGLVFGFDRI